MFKRLFFLVAAFMVGNTHAQGIPVIDVAAIAQFLQQIKALETQLKAISGSRGVGGLKLPESSAASSDWIAILQAIQSHPVYVSTRAQYPTFADRPKQNALYDAMAKQAAVTAKIYERSTQRSAVISGILAVSEGGSYLDGNDLKRSSDLNGRLSAESSFIGANREVVSLVQTQMAAEVTAAREAAAKEANCFFMKRSGC